MPPSSSSASQDPLGEDGGRDGRRRKRRKKTRADRSSVPKRRKEARTEEDGGGANRRGLEEAAASAASCNSGGGGRGVAATGNGENMEILGAGGTEASASTVLFPKGGACRNDFFCTYIFFSLNLDGRVRPRPPGTLAAAEEGNWPAEKEARPPMLAKE